ncbi:MAG TPA: hypothetical protein PKA50_04230 [Gemmatimonadales bacterium]|nr:hypothetical protein [Gemmatimonadales bacterium]
MLQDSALYQGKRKHLMALLRQKGITDTAVLDAMQQIPRHCFLDSAFSEQAYEDKALSIDEGQTISQPAQELPDGRAAGGEDDGRSGVGHGFRDA